MLADWPLALAVCVFLVVWLSALLFAVVQKRASWADPVIQFLAFFALFTLPLPIRALITHEIEGDVTTHLPQLLPFLPASVLLAALAIVFFFAAYYSGVGSRLAGRLRLTAPPRREPYLAAVVLGGFSLFLIGELARKSGGILNFVLLGYGSSAETFTNGYLAIGFPWLFIAACFFLYRYALFRRRRDLVIYVFGFAAIAMMQIVMGNRSIVMYMVLVTVVFVHFAIRRVSMLRLAPLVGAGFVVLNVAGFLRASHYDSAADLFARSRATFSQIQESNELRHGWYYTLTTGEFVVPFETLPQMVRSIGTDVPARWGSSFMALPLFFVPSALFPGRPLPLANWYMQQFYSAETFGLNQGRGFYFLSEAYLNFGPVGIPLLALVWGVFWRTVREYMTRARNEPGAVLLYAHSVAFMFRSISGDSRTLVVGIAEQALVPAIIGLVIIGGWRLSRHSLRYVAHD